MTRKVLIFTGFFLLVSLVSFGSCWPYQFGQLVTDWYRGMSIPTIYSYYFIESKPMSLVSDCHLKNQYIFSWEDGFYIWGIYGGNSLSQCTNVTCPTPYNDPFERIVFVAAEKGYNGTKFLIDSVRWDSSGFGYFNFDRTSGVVHEAGVLLAPKVKTPGIVLRGAVEAILEIPLPNKGFYSDPDIDPASLIAGIAVLFKSSDTRPTNLSVSEFSLVKAIPVNLNTHSGSFDVDITIPSIVKGKPYYAYTLIIEDGTERPLEAKPTLPFTSPVVEAILNPISRLMDGTPEEISLQEDYLDAKVVENPVKFVKAIKNGKEVNMYVTFSDSSNFGNVEILRSYDLVNWEKLSVINYRAEKDLKFVDKIDFEPELGVFYEIRLKDSETGSDVYVVRTRAREL